MNERIRELWNQSRYPSGRGHDEEKFAELIVRECANVAYNKQYKHSPAHTTGDCATAIKEHFGVEQ